MNKKKLLKSCKWPDKHWLQGKLLMISARHETILRILSWSKSFRRRAGSRSSIGATCDRFTQCLKFGCWSL